MPVFEAVLLALQSLRAQKLKTAFSLIGVFIGVTFLIAVVSIVEGMNRYMTDKFAGTLVGVNTFHLRRRPNFTPNVSEEEWRAFARRPRVTFDDAEAVSSGITVQALTAWQSSSQGTLEYGRKVARQIEITGATERYFEIKNLRIAQGRAFSAQEVRAGSSVVVLGHELAERLFESLDPIGREIKIQGTPFRVIGVVEAQGTIFGFSLDKFAVAPALSPMQGFVNPPRIVDALMVKAPTLEGMYAAMDQAEAIMRTRRQLRPRENNDFVLETSEGVLDFWAQINKIMLAVFPGLVAISLVVGGIVIMNIMLMAVAERTREIGLRKSLGARKRDIMRQFVAESATLATVGAALGVATGIGLAFVVSAVSPLPASVAPWSIAVGVILGAGVGIVAGVYPASRASKLDPIAALRQE